MDQGAGNGTDKRPLVFLGLSVIILIVLVTIAFKSGPFGQQFRLEQAVICQELDGNRQPLHVGNTIPYGLRQVCLWLQYASAREGSHLDVSWYYGNELVLSEPLKLMTKDGVRAFYLLQEEGTPLPAGEYRVTVSTASKVWADIGFEIKKEQQ